MNRGRNGMGALGAVVEFGRVEQAVRAVREQLAKEEEEFRKRRRNEKDYCLTSKDVARIFEVHPKTVDRWRRRLGLPSKKFGRSVRFREGDVRRWDAQR